MTDEEQKKTIDRIRFVYQKARHHRTLHADGVWASVTPQLEIQFAFFNNLKPMPNEAIHSVGDDGAIGAEITPQAPEFIIRETDVTVVMNREVAKSMVDLLNRMVHEADEHLGKLQAATQAHKEEPQKA
jgi:hypothetical protein